MKLAAARTVMVLAVRCLGSHRGEWAYAMESEFQAVAEDGKPLSFAIGCLAAAMRQLPDHDSGRLAVANNLLAIFVIVPGAALLLASVLAGFPMSYFELLGVNGIHADGVQTPLLTEATLSGLPCLAVLVLFLAALNLRMAWLALERDWIGVTAAAAMSAAVAVTLVIFTAVVFAAYSAALAHAAALAVQLTALAGVAQWDRRCEWREMAPRA